MTLQNPDSLRQTVTGAVLLPNDADYKKYSTSWNLDAVQNPAVVVVAKDSGDIVAAVRYAKKNKLGIGVMATGHGVGKPCNGGLLINTSQMRKVVISDSRSTAIVEAGAQWKDVIAPAAEYGLATLAGSAPHVGVVGYTMGGGSGLLGRKYGLNSSSVVSADVVTADGELLHVSEEKHADLFWAVKGGGGNFCVVTSLEFKLYPLSKVFGGAVFYPIDHAKEVLEKFSSWSESIPDEVTPSVALMNMPDAPAVSAPLRGKSLVAIKGCYCGEDLREGEKLFAPMRNIATPVADTFEIMPVGKMDLISKDPVDPMPVLSYGTMLKDLSNSTIDTILSVAGPESKSPLAVLEVRKLGGALNKSGNIQIMGSGAASYSLNALGAAFNPELAASVNQHLSTVASAVKNHSTGEVSLNYVEVNPSKERVRSAYTESDWKKLVALKKRFDPDNLFRFNKNISE